MSKRAALLLTGVLGMLALAAAMLLSSPGASATSRCETVEGPQTTTADFTNFTTQGRIRGDLDGNTAFRGDVTSFATVFGMTSPPLNATSHYTGDLTITTRHGILKTRSVGVFEVTPSGVGTQFDRILSDQSTGRFQGAVGYLYFTFRSDATGTRFTSTYTGLICG